MSFDGDSYHEFEQIDLTGPGASAHEYDHHGHSLLPSDWLDNIPGAEPQGTGNEMTMGDGGSFDPASGPPLDDSTSPGIHPPNSSQDHHPSSHGNEGEGYATAEDIADLSGSDESEPEPEPRWDQEHCMESCRPAWRAQQRKITKQKAKIRSLKSRIYRIHERDRKKINELRRRLRDAEARLEKQRKKPRTNTSPKWTEAAVENLEKRPGHVSWADVCSLAHRQSNICQDPRTVHPLLNLKEPTMSDPANAVNRETYFNTPPQMSPLLPSEGPNAFYELPPTVHLGILRHLLTFEKPIHALSRMDPDVPFQRGSQPHDYGEVRLLHRFHIGSSSVNLTYSTKPQHLLSPLLVSKYWHFLGSTLFYGCNTFIFSSLGEWSRFSKGIGVKLQRLQHIEFVWKGAKLRAQQTPRTPFETDPLMLLTEAIRLESVKIYIQEKARSLMRRPKEKSHLIRHMANKTVDQPNFRLNRCLRHLQGVEYLMSLRGIKSIEIYCLDQWLRERKIEEVRDWTFVLDVMNSVYRTKNENNEIRSRLQNLAPLCAPYQPHRSDWLALEKFMEEIASPEDNDKLPDGDEDLVPVGTQAVDIAMEISDDDDADVNFGGGINLDWDGGIQASNLTMGSSAGSGSGIAGSSAPSAQGAHFGSEPHVYDIGSDDSDNEESLFL